jgi:hypothetical protein
VGSDRLKEFDTLLQRYNDAPDKKGKQLFKFDSVKVISAGERDPDAEGVSGMSASKMRDAAEKGDFDSFKTGIPATLRDADKKKLYFEVRKAMGIREEREMGDDYDSLRDAYLTGKIWNVGESVEANGVSGEVVRKGTNYLSFVSEDGKVHKAWLHEIVGVNQMSGPTGQIFALKSEEVELDEDASVYKKTARKNKSGKSTFAFGRRKKLDGQPKEKGGYFVWKLSQNYDGKVKGGIRNSWAQVAKDLSYSDAVKLMNKKLGRKEFKEEVELDERNYAKEYANYQGTPEQIARRSSRNKARRAMGDKAVRGMDVGHKDNDPLNNSPDNLRNEDPSDNRREPRLREKPELDEKWYNDVMAKMSQINHSKSWDKIAKEFAAGMKDPEHRKHPSAWAADVALKYNGINGRSLVKYINKLVDDGKLPKELKAELHHESFKSFVNRIQEVKQDKDEEACWDGYKQVGMKKKGDKEVPNCVPEENELNEWGEVEEESEYQGRKVTLNKPSAGDVKKSKVYVKNEKGNVVKVNFGDPNMTIKKSIPARRKSFRARHNCENPGPKWMARYWSCKAW